MICGCIGPCVCGLGSIIVTSGRVVPPELYEAGEQVVFPISGIPVAPPLTACFQLAVPSPPNFAQTFATNICGTSVNAITVNPGTIVDTISSMNVGINPANVRLPCRACSVMIRVLVRGVPIAGVAPLDTLQRRTYSKEWPLIGDGMLAVNIAPILFNGDEFDKDSFEATVFLRYQF